MVTLVCTVLKCLSWLFTVHFIILQTLILLTWNSLFINKIRLITITASLNKTYLWWYMNYSWHLCRYYWHPLPILINQHHLIIVLSSSLRTSYLMLKLIISLLYKRIVVFSDVISFFSCVMFCIILKFLQFLAHCIYNNLLHAFHQLWFT